MLLLCWWCSCISLKLVVKIHSFVCHIHREFLYRTATLPKERERYPFTGILLKNGVCCIIYDGKVGRLSLSKTPLCNHVNKSKQQYFKICARNKAYKDNFGGFQLGSTSCSWDNERQILLTGIYLFDYTNNYCTCVVLTTMATSPITYFHIVAS